MALPKENTNQYGQDPITGKFNNPLFSNTNTSFPGNRLNNGQNFSLTTGGYRNPFTGPNKYIPTYGPAYSSNPTNTNATIPTRPNPLVSNQQSHQDPNQIRALQEQLNNLHGKEQGYVPLKTDGIYGPKTIAAMNFKPNSGIVSSTQARNDLTQGSNQLDTFTNTTDPYLEYLQKQYQGLQDHPSEISAEEKSATNRYSRLQQKTVDDFNNYKAGLETLGIQTGLSQYAPGLQADKMINAANAETSKLAEIQDKEDYAVAKAKQARMDKDSKALKDSLEEIRQYKKDKADELQQQLNKRTQDITVANSAATYLYKELQKMSPDQRENLILETANQLNVNPATLIQALSREQDDQYKFKLTTDLQRKSLAGGSGGGSSGNYTKTQLIKLRAAGINPKEDSELADALIAGEIKPAKGKVGAKFRATNRVIRKATKLGYNEADQSAIEQSLAAGYPIEYIGYLLGYDDSLVSYLKNYGVTK